MQIRLNEIGHSMNKKTSNTIKKKGGFRAKITDTDINSWERKPAVHGNDCCPCTFSFLKMISEEMADTLSAIYTGGMYIHMFPREFEKVYPGYTFNYVNYDTSDVSLQRLFDSIEINYGALAVGYKYPINHCFVFAKTILNGYIIPVMLDPQQHKILYNIHSIKSWIVKYGYQGFSILEGRKTYPPDQGKILDVDLMEEDLLEGFERLGVV